MRTAVVYDWSCCECNRNNSMRSHPDQCTNPRCNHLRVNRGVVCGACYIIETHLKGR